MPTETGVWNQEEADEGHVFDYRLAQWIGQYLSKHTPVIDLGCGKATYLRYLHDIGFEDLLGVEGFDLRDFEFGNIIIHDLTEPIDLKKRGNIICLEVAEHIPEEGLDIFLNTITKHLSGKLILSWAIPGQAGQGHVSCRHNIDVIHTLQALGLRLLHHDSLKARAMVSNHAHWFRNTLLIFEG